MSDSIPDAQPALAAIEFVPGLGVLASRYDVLFCDVWGVLHDGITAFPVASDTLARYRAGGGRVVLVSNAPRPGPDVARQLDGLGTSRDAYDAVVTSGDITRAAIAERGTRRVYHIGPARDLGLFEGTTARFVGLDEAEYVICTGLFEDETETVADYQPALEQMKRDGLAMICANPDIVVERGHRLIPCAGALAAAYEAIGGAVTTGGKPHRPIYEAAVAEAARLLGREPDRARILAVGDAIRTDVVGGRAFGLDVLLIARGIHAPELGLDASGTIPRDTALAWLADQEARPTAVTATLAWG